mmetsp:Transcript_95029/g.290692  ORF Transcript_95029/g.290692 Transcript_95029/m.290692 type:complete len:231 (+) Transcript_95029:197-889(+)
MGLLGVRHRAEAAGKTAERAEPHVPVAEAHLQAVPPRRPREVGEGDRGHGLPAGAALVEAQRFELAEPPSERAAHLHLPLQLYAFPDDETVEALQHAVRVGVLRRQAVVAQAEPRPQGGPHRGGAESQPMRLRKGNELGRNRAGAQVLRNEAFTARASTRRLQSWMFGGCAVVIRDPRRHGRHRKARHLLPLENLQKHTQPALARLAVEGLPIAPVLLQGELALGKHRPP